MAEPLGFRKDEATGEKPWTTDPLRIRPSEETEVSESRCSLCRAVSEVPFVVAEKQESVEFCKLSEMTLSADWGFGSEVEADV